jgi:resuscitation-promoting factor RpfB
MKYLIALIAVLLAYSVPKVASAATINIKPSIEPPKQIEKLAVTIPAPVEAAPAIIVPAVPKPTPKPIAAPAKSPSAPKAVTGSKEDWMRAAGIPQSQWASVDYIVSRESGWNPRAVNKSSGACGLVQALPCSKLGANWSDPVTALRWQFSYVTARYGGYGGAVSFWKANHWY